MLKVIQTIVYPVLWLEGFLTYILTCPHERREPAQKPVLVRDGIEQVTLFVSPKSENLH